MVSESSKKTRNRRNHKIVSTIVHLFYRSFGSMSTPLFDTSGSVHMLLLKQHGLRFPALSFEHAVSIRRLRVSGCLVERIHRIHSQRAIGVISIHILFACGEATRAFFKSAGILGSGHSFAGSIASVAVSPASTRAALRMFSSTL